ncbi:MAG: hypothetical protein ACRDU5_21480 [Mycobacterium sp.]
MADLNPEYRRELADQIKVNAPDSWWKGEDGDPYERLVDDLIRLGWAYPPKRMPPKPMPPQDPGVNG